MASLFHGAHKPSGYASTAVGMGANTSTGGFEEHMKNMNKYVKSRSMELESVPWDIRHNIRDNSKGKRWRGPLMPPGDFHKRGEGVGARMRARQRAIDQKQKEDEEKHKISVVGHTVNPKQQESKTKKRSSSRG